MRAILKRAAASVPKDSLRIMVSEVTSNPASKHASAWRSAGARASDGADASLLLYWKR